MWPVKELKLSAALKHLPAKSDELVVVDGTEKLRDGTQVEVRTSSSPPSRRPEGTGSDAVPPQKDKQT